MSLLSLLVQRATVERAAATTDAAGDSTLAWSAVATDIPCLVDIRRPARSDHPAGDTARFDARGYFLPDADIRPRPGADGCDRVTVEGTAYRVRAASVVSGPSARLLEAELERVE